MSKATFAYGQRTMTEAQEAEREIAARKMGGGNALLKDGETFLKVTQPGEYRVRFLPPTWNLDKATGRSRANFYGLHVADYYLPNTKKSIICTSETFGVKDDPIAAYRSSLYEQSHNEKDAAKAKALREKAKEYFPRRKFFFAVIDRNDEDRGIKIMCLPEREIGELIALAKNSKNPNGCDPVDSPDDGMDLEFETIKGTSGYPEYKGRKFAAATPLMDDEGEAKHQLEEIVMTPLTERFDIPTAEELKAALDAEIAAEKADDEDSWKPAESAAEESKA